VETNQLIVRSVQLVITRWPEQLHVPCVKLEHTNKIVEDLHV
jgi:hypothetical protein